MCDKCLERQAKAPVDHSYESLVELQEKGYTDVRFVARDVACPICRRVHNLKVNIEKLISETEYDASIYTLAHPGCNCFLEASGKDLRTVKFDYRGLR